MKYEFLDESTADVCFRAYGKDLNEVFENAALAMFEIMVDTSKVKPVEERRIHVEGEDLQSLMFKWLNELLYHSGSEGIVFSKFDVRIDERRMILDATCRGERMDPDRHELRMDVKAATYHLMKFGKNGELWAQVIVDV